jgi:hypothetical protein
MIDYSHLDTIQLRLSNTKRHAANCKPHQVLFWALEISQIEKELAGEYKFLDIAPPAPCTLDDDQLLAELLA